MATPRQLLNLTAAVRAGNIAKSLNARILAVDNSFGVDEHGIFRSMKARVRCLLVSGSGNVHLTEAKLYLKKNTEANDMDCWTTCDCGQHKYQNEVPLTIVESSDIIQSNGSFPKITNPRMHPTPCKHAIRVLLTLVATTPTIPDPVSNLPPSNPVNIAIRKAFQIEEQTGTKLRAPETSDRKIPPHIAQMQNALRNRRLGV